MGAAGKCILMASSDHADSGPRRDAPLSPEKWRSFFDKDGRIFNESEVRRCIFRGQFLGASHSDGLIFTYTIVVNALASLLHINYVTLITPGQHVSKGIFST